MRKFDFIIKVATGVNMAEEIYYLNYYLWPDGTLHLEDFEDDIPLDEIEVSWLLSPAEILGEFIRALSEGVKRQKQRLKELKAVQQIVEAVSKLIR